jgi:transposase
MEQQRRERRAFTDAHKAEVVALCQTSGKSIREISRDLDLTESSVRRWVTQAEPLSAADWAAEDFAEAAVRERLPRLRTYAVLLDHLSHGAVIRAQQGVDVLRVGSFAHAGEAHEVAEQRCDDAPLRRRDRGPLAFLARAAGRAEARAFRGLGETDGARSHHRRPMPHLVRPSAGPPASTFLLPGFRFALAS